MKIARSLMMLPLLCTGCMATLLERQTLNQASTITDIRFQQVMNNLALMAASPDELPSYAAVGEGSQQVTEQWTFSAATLWTKATFKGFSSETIGLGYEQIIQPSWTLDPVFDQDQLEALQAAFNWAVFGPPPPESKSKKVLDLFQVSRDLAKLPPNWLGVGKIGDVPHGALYKSHYKGKWMWVTPEGMEGLSAFTLIIQDIATVDTNRIGYSYVKPSIDVKVTVGQDNKTTGAKAPTLENKSVTQDVRAWVVRSDDGSYNQLKGIVATVPGMGLGDNTVFLLDPQIIVQTSEPPNAEGTQPPPAPTEGLSTSPSYVARSRSAKAAPAR